MAKSDRNLYVLLGIAFVLVMYMMQSSTKTKPWPTTAGLWVLRTSAHSNTSSLPVAPHPFAGDKRGWIGNPFDALNLFVGDLAVRDVHIGVIRAGGTRGNHRHHNKHELIIVFGAEMDLRVGEVTYKSSADDVLALRCPPGTPHLIHNIDGSGRQVSLVAFVDSEWDPNNPATDYGVWQPAVLLPDVNSVA